MYLEKSVQRIQHDLEELSVFTSTPGRGTTRLPFSKEARESVNYLAKIMSDAGMNVHQDAAGNIIGTIDGEYGDAPAIVMGSHYDSVVNGGNFDGIAGIVAGIEIARILKESRIKLKRNFTVIGFCDEEGMRFGTGYFGSKAVLGQVDINYLHQFADKDQSQYTRQ